MNDQMSERKEGAERVEWIRGAILNSWLSIPYSMEGKQEQLAEVNS